jgi:uncharacterized membrane protein
VNRVLARPLRSLQRNILAGIITIGPLFVTYLIFSFLLGALAKAGLPVVQLFAAVFPENWLSQPWLQSVLAVVLTLVVLWVVGRVTSLVIGRQAFELFEALLERLPVVAKIYTSVRQLLDSMLTGEELAAVLLPNAINPTSAFLQILPIQRVTDTDLTMEQAMSMIMTGGAVGPESIRFSQAALAVGMDGLASAKGATPPAPLA